MTQISDILVSLSQTPTSSPEFTKHCYQGLTEAEKSQLTKQDVQVYSGKIRDMVFRGDKVEVIHSDRLTAFDKLIGYVPYKGTMLAAISEHWLKDAEGVVPTHYIDRPEGKTLLVERRDPIKVEVIVRGYLAGSMMRAYQKGERIFCGVKLPDGLEPFARLPEPIITPTTKAAAFEHDEEISAEDVVKKALATESEWNTITELAFKLFDHGTKRLGDQGWILVDTKYEFGRGQNKPIAVIDEIHTPDSSRFWKSETYETNQKMGHSPDMLDKEIVRRWLMEQGFNGEGQVPDVPAKVLVGLGEVYLNIVETLTGTKLTVS